MAYYCGFQYGVIYEEQGDYERALRTFFSLLEQDKFEAGKSDQSNLHNSIGILFNKLEKYSESKKHFQLALDFIDSDESVDRANIYGNLSDLYAAEGDFDVAREYSLKSIKIFESLDHNFGIAHGYLDMGMIGLMQNDFSDAERYTKMAKEIFETNDYRDKKLAYVHLGEILFAMSKINDAEAYFKKALSLNLELTNKMNAHKGLAKIYRLKKEYVAALDNYEKYSDTKDSLSGIETIKNINRLQFQYETAQKDKEITEQDLTIKEQENTILINEAKATRIMLVAFLALGALVFLFFYYRQRQKLKNKEIEALKVSQELTKLEALIEGEENERQRLAQDLHDGINGDLSVIKYKITSIDKKKLDAEESEEYTMAISMLDNAIEQVRSISHDLAPPSLQNYNIVEAISQYCLKIASGSDLQINFQNYGEVVKIPTDLETAIYRITQELVNNSLKHADANIILVQINFHESALHVSVQDDGKGYDHTVKKTGLGLNNIISRTEFLGAELHVESSDQGTLTTIDVNFKTQT